MLLLNLNNGTPFLIMLLNGNQWSIRSKALLAFRNVTYTVVLLDL